MSSRHWIAGFALGIAYLNNPIVSHASGQPASEQGDAKPEQEGEKVDLSGIEVRLDAIAGALENLKNQSEAKMEAQRAERDLEAQETMARWSLPLFSAAVAANLLTAVGLILIFFTLKHTRRAAVFAGVAARQARRATSASWRAVHITQEIGIAQNRAFIFCERVSRSWIAKKGESPNHDIIKEWEFFPVWKNSGQTPTRNAVCNVNYCVRRTPLPEDFDFPDYAEGAVSSMIGPGATMHGAHYKISVEDLIRIREGQYFAYAWGWFEYNDIFPTTPRHRSEFCFRIDVTSNPNFKEFMPKYAKVGAFNGFDDDCYRKAHEKALEG